MRTPTRTVVRQRFPLFEDSCTLLAAYLWSEGAESETIHERSSGSPLDESQKS